MKCLSILITLLSAAALAGCVRVKMADLVSNRGEHSPPEYYNHLLELLSDDAILSSDDMKATFEQLAEAKASGEDRKIFEALVELADVNDRICSANMVKTFLDIFQLIDEHKTDEKHAIFVNRFDKYLKTWGRVKFTAVTRAEKDEDIEIVRKLAQILVKSGDDAPESRKKQDLAES